MLQCHGMHSVCRGLLGRSWCPLHQMRRFVRSVRGRYHMYYMRGWVLERYSRRGAVSAVHGQLCRLPDWRHLHHLWQRICVERSRQAVH